ncbi:hypothetical protein JCM11641_002053 [Rhodosporidiobolus odoratus]
MRRDGTVPAFDLVAPFRRHAAFQPDEPAIQSQDLTQQLEDELELLNTLSPFPDTSSPPSPSRRRTASHTRSDSLSCLSIVQDDYLDASESPPAPPAVPISPIMAAALTLPSTSTSSIYKDALLRLEPISPSTWPEWLEALPYCVGGVSGVAGVEFYLEGDLTKPVYSKTTMADVLSDTAKAAEYTRWTKVAEVLKTSIKLYGGAEAAARIDGLETKFGDAPAIWSKLKEWYGHLETGAERAVLYADIANERWDEAAESPAVYFQRLATKVARYNTAAKADALLASNKSDPNVIADLSAAISSSQQRDLISLYLPSSYAETLSPNIKRTTSLDELKIMVNNLYLQREEGGGDGTGRQAPDPPRSEGRQEEQEEAPPATNDNPPLIPPQPTPPSHSEQNSESRSSRRIANLPPTHFVPLQGAPEPTPSDEPPPSAVAMSTFLPSDDFPLFPNPACPEKCRFVAGTRRSPPSPPRSPPPTPRALRLLRLAKSLSPHLKTCSFAFAVHDPSLESDPNSSILLTLNTSLSATRAELVVAMEQAFATSPAWSGSANEPTYKQAMERADVEKWVDAMMAELAAFEATGTWETELVDLPSGRKAIAVKWVLLIKRDAEGRVIKYKARLVARGDQQVEGVDYDQTHSSTVHLTTVRLVASLLAANPTWGYRQFDISNAYLLGILDHEIYIRQAPGFIDPSRPSAVRRLRKALYGLKQGGREWQKVLREALEKAGFRRTDADHGLYVRRREGKVVMIPTHVDDGLLVGDDDLDAALEEISELLEGKLKKVETGLFLGMQIIRGSDGFVSLLQSHYTRSVLSQFFPDGLSTAKTPLHSTYSSIVAATEEGREDCPYRELLGALVYLSACTRPDIAFALSFASRFSSCPAKRHWQLLVHISDVTGWSDADHGADKDTRRSVSGYVFGVGEEAILAGAISWLSRRQASVSISSTEAEYIALSEAAREMVWLRQLLRELGYKTSSPSLIRGDNSGSLVLANHPTSHSRTKHIAVHYHFTRELVEEGKIVLKWVPTDEMVANVFTKGLGLLGVKHALFTGRCGLRIIHREGRCEEEKKG